MSHFTIQELNLICIYDPGTRTGLMAELTNMTSYLTQEETELKNLADSVVDKLCKMTEEEYAVLTRNTDFTFDEEDAELRLNGSINSTATDADSA